MENIIQPPALEIDKVLYKDSPMPAHVVLERRIVINLFAHLKAAGFSVFMVHDGDEENPVADDKAAMEKIFDLDESRVYFKSAAGRQRWIFLVHGNGEDVISDWGVPNVSDGFDEAVSSFETERFL